MFLHPRLKEILEIAFHRDVTLHADNGTNLNHASPDILEALVTHRFRSLTVSLDGASPDTYARYRVKGDFNRVIGNIRTLNGFKRKHASGFPLLTWQFIVFGHNEHEIEAAKALAAELGMAFKPKLSWDDDVSPVVNPGLVQIQTGLSTTRAQHHEDTGKEYTRQICHQLWNSPVLNWDGRVMGCCRNFWGDFGANAFEGGLEMSLATPKLQKARAALMGRMGMDSDIPCATCDLYLTMHRDGNWLSGAEIEQSAGEQGVLTSVVVEAGESLATHADLFLAPGHGVNRLLLAQPPAAKRFQMGVSYSSVFFLKPGDYTVYALPRRLDPAYRTRYPALPAVTLSITIPERPVAQEFRVRLND